MVATCSSDRVSAGGSGIGGLVVVVVLAVVAGGGMEVVVAVMLVVVVCAVATTGVVGAGDSASTAVQAVRSRHPATRTERKGVRIMLAA